MRGGGTSTGFLRAGAVKYAHQAREVWRLRTDWSLGDQRVVSPWLLFHLPPPPLLQLVRFSSPARMWPRTRSEACRREPPLAVDGLESSPPRTNMYIHCPRTPNSLRAWSTHLLCHETFPVVAQPAFVEPLRGHIGTPLGSAQHNQDMNLFPVSHSSLRWSSGCFRHLSSALFCPSTCSSVTVAMHSRSGHTSDSCDHPRHCRRSVMP